MRTGLVAGNWKMHGTLRSVRALASELAKLPLAESNAEVVVAPGLAHLTAVVDALGDANIAVAAQDLSAFAGEGAHTGDVSGKQLLDAGCRWAIVGHSERREDHSESDELVAGKVRVALDQGLSVILCVGESLEQRESGETEAVVAKQLAAVLDVLEPADANKLVLAYEPIWAIGTGLTATPEQAQAVHAGLRSVVAQWSAQVADELRIVYGGSVKADNAATLFAQPDIDGGLVGGASLDAGSFADIIRAIG